MVQVSIPLWALVHLPVVVTVTTAMFTPKVRNCGPEFTMILSARSHQAQPVHACAVMVLTPSTGQSTFH